jgi:hypothetical protein
MDTGTGAVKALREFSSFLCKSEVASVYLGLDKLATVITGSSFWSFADLLAYMAATWDSALFQEQVNSRCGSCCG